MAAGRKKLDATVNYFELPRKQLQSHCKKLGFPANKTNQLMAEFLTGHFNSEENVRAEQSVETPDVKSKGTRVESLPTLSTSEHTVSEMQARVESLPTPSASQHTISEMQVSMESLPTPSASQHTVSDMQASMESLPTPSASQHTVSDMQARVESLQTPSASEHTVPAMQAIVESLESPSASQHTVSALQATNAPSGRTNVTSETEDSHLREVGQQTSPLPGSVANPVATSATETTPTLLNTQPRPETPLPVSVMPYESLASPPKFYVSRETGVQLFVDLENDSLPSLDLKLPGEGLNISICGDKRRDYEAWAGRPALPTENTEVDALGSFKTLDGTERSLPLEVSKIGRGLRGVQVDGARDENERTYNISSRISVAAPRKSSLFSPKNKSGLKVSFLSPEPFTPTGSIDCSGRSAIVEEWSGGNRQPGLSEEQEQSGSAEKLSISSADEGAADDELSIREGIEIHSGEETEESMSRSLLSTSTMENPAEGFVTEAVKSFEKLSTRVPTPHIRKESMKSSRLAAELNRASRLGKPSRVGILESKRPVDEVAPITTIPLLPKDGEISSEVEGFSPLSAWLLPEIAAAQNPSQGIVSATRLEHVSKTGIAEAITAEENYSNKNASEGAEIAAVRCDDILEVGIVPSRGEASLPRTSSLPETNQTESFSFPSFIPGEPVRLGGVGPPVESMASDEENSSPMLIEGGFSPMLIESPEKSETPVLKEVSTSAIAKSVETESLAAEEIENLPPSMEQSVADMSWMTKPLQLPERKTKSKEKVRTSLSISANVRRKELMEQAVERATARKEVAVPVMKAAARKEEAVPVTKAAAKKEEAIPVLKTVARKEDANPIMKVLSPRNSNLQVEDFSSPGKPSVGQSVEGEVLSRKLSWENDGKENQEWAVRQEQHKTPLTGRSKEKALRDSEMNAANLRANLLRQRRGMA